MARMRAFTVSQHARDRNRVRPLGLATWGESGKDNIGSLGSLVRSGGMREIGEAYVKLGGSV